VEKKGILMLSKLTISEMFTLMRVLQGLSPMEAAFIILLLGKGHTDV